MAPSLLHLLPILPVFPAEILGSPPPPSVLRVPLRNFNFAKQKEFQELLTAAV